MTRVNDKLEKVSKKDYDSLNASSKLQTVTAPIRLNFRINVKLRQRTFLRTLVKENGCC